MWQQYVNACSVAEVLELLAEFTNQARIIAGGTDLMLEMERGKRPDVHTLIDITRIAGLDAITLHGDTIRLGALVNHNHVVASPLLRARALPLVQACWEVGAPQIRNRATIGGNLITGSSANDTITPLLALDASVTLASVGGERTIPLRDFYTGLRKTVMRPDEMLTAVTFPALDSDETGIFIKLGLRRAQAISVTNVAVVLKRVGDTVVSAALTMGSVAPTVIRLTAVEDLLRGKALTQDVIQAAARLAGTIPTPISDVRSPADYRAEMIKVLVARALRLIAEGKQVNGLPSDPAMLWGESHARVNSSSWTTRATHTAEAPEIQVIVNGQNVTSAHGINLSLLDWLREDARLPGSKEGCGEGECGACTVFLDGVAVMACMVPAARAHGAQVTTIEGLGTNDALHAVQQAFIDHGAVQCGYCTPGLVMAGAKLMEEHPQPTQAQMEQSISGNLCRCTGYYKIIEAFKAASQ